MKLKLPINKAERIAYLKQNKSEILELKKSVIKHSDSFSTSPLSTAEDVTIKALVTNHKTDVENGVIKRTIVGNTYNWLDSHSDVHINGLFAKSISERKDKVRHYHDHLHQLTAKVGTPTDVYEKNVQWKDLGVNKFGYTQALLIDTDIKKSYNNVIFDMYKSNEIDQHSVGMMYVKVALALDDQNEKEEFAVWQKHINDIGNRTKAEEDGYFFAVYEAKLIEVSAVVDGSNELTPTVENIEPLDDTQKEEPTLVTPEVVEVPKEKENYLQIKSKFNLK
jgi:hypothetical protein